MATGNFFLGQRQGQRATGKMFWATTTEMATRKALLSKPCYRL